MDEEGEVFSVHPNGKRDNEKIRTGGIDEGKLSIDVAYIMYKGKGG